MFKFHDRIITRPGGLFTAFWLALALYAGMSANVRAQLPPANASVTNAQVIFGTSGTAYGTNLYVTAFRSKPSADPYPAEFSIWYVWTAPITGTVEFNTRGSTYPNGQPLDTVLAVYTNNSGNSVSFSDLGVVSATPPLTATNDNDPNSAYGVTSRVDFPATLGTIYYIQVDGSQTSTPGTSAQGYVTLNWEPSLVAGGFGFSATVFPFSSLEDFLPDNDGSITPSLYDYPSGSATARVTVTRTGGYTGKCEVLLTLTNNFYTNLYTTNVLVTNTFSTNQETGEFTNVLVTNLISVNWFTNDEDGALVGLPLDNWTVITASNTSSGPGILTISNMLLASLGLPDFYTNFFCTHFPIVTTNFVTNSDTPVTTNKVVTVVYCTNLSTNVPVAAAIAGIHYVPATYLLTFDDFQMSRDILVQIDPPLANYAANGLAVQDCPIPGPEDYFNNVCTGDKPTTFNTDINYIYSGLNASVLMTLSNPTLDPSEDQDIIPPTISQPTADLNILNYYGNPNAVFTNIASQFVINFERETFRVDRNAGVATIWVQTYPRIRPVSYTVHYTIDSQVNLDGQLIALNWDNWPTVADAEYAVPSDGQSNYDFTLPTNSGWTGQSGVLTFPVEPDISAQPISIPITNNGSQEFDEDILVELYLTTSDLMGNETAMPPGYSGNIFSAHLTINFDNTTDNLQPGGAVDRTWNVDAVPESSPPENPTPGANGGVGAAVQAVAIQPDGKAVIGGYFDTYDDANAYGIARLLVNGFLDTSFNTGTGVNNGDVYALALDSSGRVIIGGSFASFNNANSVNNIARLNSNGSLDTTFKSGVGFNGPIWALAIDASGNILVGGDFTSYNTTNCNHIARLLPSGGLDPSFLPNTGNGSTNFGTDHDVEALALDSFGNIVLGGQFDYVNGKKMSYLARLLPSGALDASFAPGIGPDDTVYSVAVETNNNNEIVIGGAFQNYNLVSRNSMALIANNGALDTSFTTGTGANGTVYSVVIQPDGNVLMAGQFTSYNTTRRIGLARLLPNGWLDTSFMDTAYNQFAGLVNPYYVESPNPAYALGLEPSGNIIVGGTFTTVGGGFKRDDTHTRINVAQIIGASTVGYGTATLTYETGGIGNCPGNITLTQTNYEGLDTQGSLYLTLQRTNGSLGPATVTLGTNVLAPGPGDATSADFGLNLATTTATYEDLWDIYKNPPAGDYGWRKSDGFYGFNNVIQPEYDNGASALDILINNDLSATADLYAGLSLLNLNSYGHLVLGGVPIPTEPALGLPGSQLEILLNNFPVGVVGYNASNYTTLNTSNFVLITVLRTNGSSGAISVHYATSDGTARVAAGDYTATSGKLTFGAGITSASFVVPIGGFSTLQPTKYFNLSFNTPSVATILSNVLPPLYTNATVTIIDGSFTAGHLSFSSPNFNVTKGGVATVDVVRTGGAVGQLTVQCATSNGTNGSNAVNGLNYTGVTNTLFWDNQDSSTKTVSVQTLQDNTVDGSLTLNVSLFNATNIGSTNNDSLIISSPSNATVTIQESDSYGNFSFQNPNFNVLQNAGQALITVVRTGGTTGTVVLGYSAVSDSNAVLPILPAVAGTNFGVVSSPPLASLTFGPGVTSQSFAVPIYYTSNESTIANRLVALQLVLQAPAATNLSAPGIASLASNFPASGTLTILDPELVLNPAGSVDQTTHNGIGFNNTVYSLALQPDGSVLAGGDFTFFNQYPFNNLARLTASAAFDTSFLFDQSGPDSNVLQVLSQTTTNDSDGPVVIVGGFNQVDGVNRNGIARLNLDGSVDESFNPGSGADSTIFAVAEAQVPALAYYIGGNFANFDGVPSGGIARLNASPNSPGIQGTIDPNFNVLQGVSGSNAIIRALAVQPNNQVIVGGDFTSFNGVTYNHLVRLNEDGSVDPSFNVSTGTDSLDSVRAIAIQPDGEIVIGGSFTNVNGSNLNYIARLNPDGSVDTNFNLGVGGNNSVLALAIDSQERILVGGEFTTFSGVTRSGITRLNPDGTVDPSINFGSGANGGVVDTLAIETDDEIDVGGSFSTFEGISENNYVRLYGLATVGNGAIQFSKPVFGVLENATNATITLQRQGGEGTNAQTTVSILFYTSDGTAFAGTNYTAISTNVTFPLGETFENVTISITNNQLVSSNTIVNLNLSNPTNATIGPQASAMLIITNVNSAVGFSAQSYSQSANAPSGEAVIPIVRIGNPNTTVGITVFTGTNGSASPFVNYVPTTNFLIFNPGVMTNYFNVPILNSPNMFSDLTVGLGMSGPSNTSIGSPASATLTIDSVNTSAGVLVFSQTNYTVTASSAGTTNAVITVIRTNGSSGAVSVTLTTSNGTAVAGTNYLSVQTTLNFADGQLSQSTNIPVLQQNLAGPNLTVLLNLSNPTGGATIGGATQETLTILDSIEFFSFSTSPYFFPENQGTALIEVVRGGPITNTASVNYYTSDLPNASEANGDAVANIDYVPVSNSLSFGAGVSSALFPVTILQGNVVNSPLSFYVNLNTTAPNTQTAAPNPATVIILSDVTGFELPTNAYTVAENGSNIVITVNRINPSTGAASVQFATSDGTNQLPALNAVNHVDYVATNGTLNFLNGQGSNSFTITILNPNIVENSKTFNVTLSNPQVLTLPNPSTNAYLLSPSNATVTITNVLTGVSFGSPTFSVSECAAEAVIPVIITGLTNNPVSVVCSTVSGGTAVLGTNYDFSATNFNFQPGQTTANFFVPVINNHIIGPNHTVVLSLSDAVNAQLLSPSTAILTIDECNGAYIVQSGTAFVSGSTLNNGGVIFSNETVTILFGLRDIAGLNTTNLVATLLATNGITNVSGPQNYGVLIPNGPTVARPFTFTAQGTNGQTMVATLALQDGSQVYSNVFFGFTLGGKSTTFSTNETLLLFGSNNPPSKAHNSNPPNDGYPSQITVSGIVGNVTGVSMNVTNFGHTYPSDVAMVLQSPAGQDALLMSDCGGSVSVSHVSLTFSQGATSYLPEFTAITNGTYLPSSYGFVLDLPTNAPGKPQAPLPPFPTNMNAFVGQPPNGTWSLYVADDDSLDSGYISNGWSLIISTGIPVEEDADLEMNMSASTYAATLGSTVTFTIGVTNFGPAGTTNVVITDTLPQGVTFVSDNFGATPGTNGVLTDSVATMAVSNGVTLTITVMATNVGSITNIASAVSGDPDPNSNYSQTNVVAVAAASADLGVSLGESPNPVFDGGNVTYTIVLYNNGPSAATNVTAVNVLPAGFKPVTITPSPVSSINGTITWNMGTLSNGFSATNVIVAQVSITNQTGLPSSSSLDIVTISSAVIDPSKFNNEASVKTEVEPSLLSVTGTRASPSLSWPVVSTNIVLYGSVKVSGPWVAIANPTAVSGVYTYVLPGNSGYHYFTLGLKTP